MEYCAKITDLSVSFFGRTILDALSLDVPREGITVLLGRSGSGKTTLLRALNRLNETFPGHAASGTVELLIGGEMTRIDGCDAYRVRRAVGMVFQTPNPLPMSIRRNMTLPLDLVSNIRGPRADELAKRALADVGLWNEVTDRLDAPADSLSGGQQQRLCLARALALEPDMLLLDEPTASLDRKAAYLIEELLLKLKTRYPMILVSHSIAQARKLADRIALLSCGRIARIIAGGELDRLDEIIELTENAEA